MKDKKEVTKIKTFRVVGRQGYTKNSSNALVPVQQEFEQQVNDFFVTLHKMLPDYYLDDVSFNVTKNFLPGTTIGEFEEVWYGVITYTWDE